MYLINGKPVDGDKELNNAYKIEGKANSILKQRLGLILSFQVSALRNNLFL